MTPHVDKSIARRLELITGTGIREARLVGAQHRWCHYRVTCADGRVVFAKAASADLGGMFEAEARGLRWLGDAGAAPVPEVLGWDAATLAIAWVPAEPPGRVSAEQFGRDLALLHAAGADRFGSPWPGYIASLPLGDRDGDSAATPAAARGAAAGPAPAPAGGAGAWPGWYAARRLLPYLRRASDTGVFSSGDTRLVESVVGRIDELAGPPEAPSRIHGDCWSGNVLWSGGRGWLIDPAAQGGHRETDLAMLALFGMPDLKRIIACYEEIAPLAPGWRSRVPLHQMHPLLVHACLFGTAYREAVRSAARAALSA